MVEIVSEILERARRSGDLGSALHSLAELDSEAINSMRRAYASEPDPALRALLVHASWEHRDPASIAFLVEALHDSDSEVWKQALDGMVTLASEEVKRMLNLALVNEGREEKRSWIREAIEQVSEILDNQE